MAPVCSAAQGYPIKPEVATIFAVAFTPSLPSRKLAMAGNAIATSCCFNSPANWQTELGHMNAGILKAGLDVLYFSGIHALLAPLSGGAGAIFTLHHVRPAREGAFQPNHILEVTPEFLEDVVTAVRDRGYEIVSLDEARRRLGEPGNDAPFVCFTFDDGYRDNLEYAYPIFQRHRAPFAIYIAPKLCSGEGELWWVALERIIAANDWIEISIGGELYAHGCATDADKIATFELCYWPLRRMGEHEQRDTIRKLCARYGLDLQTLCRELVMNWDEVRQLAQDPLVTIGAHTMDHFAIAKLDEREALEQMTDSAEAIAHELGAWPRHFSFPYGDHASAGPRDFMLARRAGFATAVTTRKGMLHAEHGAHLTALPRISLNGDYQSLRHVNVLLSGAPFLLWNGFRRLDVA